MRFSGLMFRNCVSQSRGHQIRNADAAAQSRKLAKDAKAATRKTPTPHVRINPTQKPKKEVEQYLKTTRNTKADESFKIPGIKDRRVQIAFVIAVVVCGYPAYSTADSYLVPQAVALLRMEGPGFVKTGLARVRSQAEKPVRIPELIEHEAIIHLLFLLNQPDILTHRAVLEILVLLAKDPIGNEQLFERLHLLPRFENMLVASVSANAPDSESAAQELQRVKALYQGLVSLVRKNQRHALSLASAEPESRTAFNQDGPELASSQGSAWVGNT